MNVTYASIDWHDSSLNVPELVVRVDRIPQRSEMKFEELHLTGQSYGLARDQEVVLRRQAAPPPLVFLHVLYAERDGYVRFIKVGRDDEKPGGALGGEFTLVDGTKKTVRSGWMISSSAIKERADVVEAIIYEEGRHGSTYGFLTVEKVKEVLAQFLPDVEAYERADGWTYRLKEGAGRSG